MSAWRRRFLTPKSAWRRWHLVHVDVEFVAGSRRAALDVAEPPVAIQFLDGLAHLVRQDTMPGFVAQNGAQALHFDLGDALGRFGAATGRVDERYDGIFGRPPESLSAAGVERTGTKKASPTLHSMEQTWNRPPGPQSEQRWMV